MSEAVQVAAPPKRVKVHHDAEHWTEVAQQCYERADAAKVRSQLSTDLGVSIDALERLGVGSGHDDYRSLSFSTWPERRQGGKVVGIIRRYRVPVENGGNKMAMLGGSQGLYLPRDWWRSSGPILVPEGGSDTAALTTIGISAVGRPSNVGGVNMLIGVLAGNARPIIVVGERDQKPDRIGTLGCKGATCDGCTICYPGRYGARVTAERLKESLPWVELPNGKRRRPRIFWRMAPKDSKDVRAWLNGTPDAHAAKLLNRLEER